MNEPHAVSSAARAFIAEAFDALTGEHVIPTPVFHPYVAVGRDYFGDTIRGLPHYQALEAELEKTYPERFAEPRKRPHAEFATTYSLASLRRASRAVGSLGQLRPWELSC